MNGVYAAIVTHFDSDLEVDHDALAAQVNRLIDGGIHGIVPNGTVGEGGSLSRDERREVIGTVVAASAGRVPVCVGVSASTPEQASEYARDAKAAGADGVMTLPPLLYRADRIELLEFFAAVAHAARPTQANVAPIGLRAGTPNSRASRSVHTAYIPSGNTAPQ